MKTCPLSFILLICVISCVGVPVEFETNVSKVVSQIHWDYWLRG